MKYDTIPSLKRGALDKIVKSGCLGCEREDGESVRYTIVNT